MATATHQKSLGAFYTGEPVARWIVNWAIRSREDTLLDPSCGGGVFLRSASQFLSNDDTVSPRIWGIDVDGEALREVAERVPNCKLINASFFSIKPGDTPRFDVAVGNPPYIRYQSFNGSVRLMALARARENGAHLPQLSSSWAPFVVHAASFLKKGGRLGMVVPVELAHAQYAREVVRFLSSRFRRIQLSIFRKKLFSDLSEDTGILLCEDYESQCTWFSIAVLNDIQEAEEGRYVQQPVNVEAVLNGRKRITHYLLTPRVRNLYEGLSDDTKVVRLGEVADVGIGYVTGCNDYFHVSVSEVKSWRLPSNMLRPAILSLDESFGAMLRRVDWARLRDLERKAYLLAIPPLSEDKLPPAVRKYLDFGVKRGVPERFKCRVRGVWYSVPHVKVGGALLSYMSGRAPRLLCNQPGLVAPNTLHVVRFEKGYRATPFVAGWYSSLTKLSCELEGHPLGGGMLKLEPSEAESVLVPVPHRRELPRLFSDLNALLRAKNEEAASDLVDRAVLRRELGLSGTECMALRTASVEMRNWRMHR